MSKLTFEMIQEAARIMEEADCPPARYAWMSDRTYDLWVADGAPSHDAERRGDGTVLVTLPAAL